MRTRKRTEITIETDRLVVVRRRETSVRAWCSSCGARVRMIDVGEAAEVAHVGPRTIYKWIEANRVHFTESAQGIVLVCLNSISSAGVGILDESRND
ncbi:MAG TPA: hypothetical protein VFV34_18085 [Blastocatellia bacterium]|nr:hypothetical protein [Blastocatellia bacterium]